jgi:hypothetical protein
LCKYALYMNTSSSSSFCICTKCERRNEQRHGPDAKLQSWWKTFLLS